MKIPGWLLALGATMMVQTISSFMGQCLPVVAPLLTASVGVAPERIGNLSSLTSLGSVLFLAFGSPYLARFGPVRSMQLGALCAVLAMGVAAFGWWPALMASALLLGIGVSASAFESRASAAVDIENRPPIGTPVMLGNMKGKIVRHFQEGCAIEFSGVQSREALTEFL